MVPPMLRTMQDSAPSPIWGGGEGEENGTCLNKDSLGVHVLHAEDTEENINVKSSECGGRARSINR